MTTLAELVTQLQSEVPPEESVPNDGQYEQAVKDAVLDFSRRCGRVKVAELSIVSGTATYALPADFQRLIWLEAVTGHDGVIVSDAGLIPVSAMWVERYTISNGQITFYPTPGYTLAREFQYKAGWAATGDDYAELGEDEAQIVLLKAKAICFSKQANAMSGSTLRYSLGAVSVDKGSSVDGKRTRMESLEKEYLEACERYNGQAAFSG